MVSLILEAQHDLAAAEAALRRGDSDLAQRLLAQLLRGDRDNLAAWRLLLRALRYSGHKQKAAQEILRLAPGDAEAQMGLEIPNHALPRTGSRARVPAFGELSQDDDPFGELADYRARNGIVVARIEGAPTPTAQFVAPTRSRRLPRLRLPSINWRLPRFGLPLAVGRSVGRLIPTRAVLALFGGGLLLAGAYFGLQPLAAPFFASALPAPTDEVPHPALAHISYQTERLQALGLDEPRRNALAGSIYNLYYFDGVRGLLLSVDVISLAPELDPVVELYDPGGELVLWNDNGDFSLGQGTLDSRLEAVLPSDGQYLISVGGIVGEGKYIISMRNH